MRKRLSGILIVIMLLSFALLFTSCGDDGNVESESEKNPITLTVTTIGDATDEAVELVEKSINRITEGKYKVHIELNVIKESEYQATIDKMFEAEYSGTVDREVYPEGYDPDDEEANEDFEGDVFPIANKDQLDIFLIPNGWEGYTNYVKNGELSELGMYLEESVGKILHKFIAADVLEICEYDGGLYAIPSVMPYGDCEFLLVNKELYAQYNYTLDEETLDTMTIESFTPFLKDVAKDIGEGKNSELVGDLIPLYNVSSMNLLSLTGRKSVVVAQSSPADGYTPDQLLPKNIFGCQSFMSVSRVANEINSLCGIMPSTDENVDFSKKFAAGFVVDDMSAVDKYSDEYYVIRVGAPKVDGDEVFGAMYGVSTFVGEHANRCMEIITAINTNKDLRNLLAYGVQNEHYIISDDTGRVSPISDDYVMPIYKTGNAFLLLQNDNMTEKELRISDDSWKYAVQANAVAKVSPYVKVTIDFSLSASDSTETHKVASECAYELEKLFDEIWVWISEYPESVNPENGDPYATFDIYMNTLSSRLNDDIYVKSSLSRKEDCDSITMQYVNWHKSEYNG